MIRKNNLFQKAVHETFRQVKQKEQISPDEINASWSAVEQMLSAPSMAVRRGVLRRRILITGSIAASLLLLISISVWQMSTTPEAVSQLNHIIVPEGKNELITLSDGTKVHIKANSHIVYPSAFAKDQRGITLIEGEVFLEVAHNSKAPFIVKANDFDVRVLGTEFNVAASKDGHPASVVLVKGCVEVENANGNRALLRPNQMADISSNGIQVQSVSVMKYVCWKDNIMLLEGDRLKTILEQLSLFYGVTIYCDETIENFALSGKLDLNDSVEKTIRVLKLSTDFTYKKDKDGFYICKE